MKNENAAGNRMKTPFSCKDCVYFDPYIDDDGATGICWETEDVSGGHVETSASGSCRKGTERNVIIAGADGFVGGNLAKELVWRGYTVYALCRNKPQMPLRGVEYIDTTGLDMDDLLLILTGKRCQ